MKTCYILIWTTVSMCVYCNILNLDFEKKNLSVCASQIVKRYASSNFLIIQANAKDLVTDILRYDIPKTALYFDSDFRRTSGYDAFDFYVFVVDTVENLKGILEKIHNTTIYRPSRKALVVYAGQSKITQLFEILWYYFTFNVVLLTSAMELYTYFPYKNGQCGHNIQETYLANCDDVRNDSLELFLTKVPLHVNGCELRLLSLEVPPYVLDAMDPVNPGLEVTIVRELAKRINFTVKVVKHGFKETGYKYSSDGSFTGLYDLLHSRRGDLMFGMLRQNTSYVSDFDSTFIHLTDQATWHVATANLISEWKNLTMIFKWKLWLMLFLFIFINSFSWWFVGRGSRDLRNYTELRRALMTGYCIMLGGSTRPPKTRRLRLLFILWSMTSILLVAAYQSKLISLLTKSSYGYQISTEEEIIKLKLNFGYFPGVRNIFSDEYANQTGFNLYGNYHYCPMVGNECIIRAAYQRDFVVLKNRRQIRYLTKR